jgi:hypothetical protein
MGRDKHVIFHHPLESRGYCHPSSMEGTPGDHCGNMALSNGLLEMDIFTARPKRSR